MNRNAETVSAGVKLAVFALVAVVVTLCIMATIRPPAGDGTEVHAIFSNASRLEPGDQVRVAGVVSGQVTEVELTDGAQARVTFLVEPDVPLTQGSRAAIKYLNLVGNRYLSLEPGPGEALSKGATIPISQTLPALDLDLLFDGFKPLFAAMSPQDVNGLAEDIVATFQGEGSTVTDLLGHTASLTQDLANRDEVIGRVLTNLNSVLAALDTRHAEFDALVSELRRFTSGLAQDRKAIGDSVARIDSLTEVTAGLLHDARPALKADVASILAFARTLNEPANRKQLEHTLVHVPSKLSKVIRTASYGSWFNYYFCDLRVRVTEANPADGFLGLLGGHALSFSAHDSSKRCNQ